MIQSVGNQSNYGKLNSGILKDRFNTLKTKFEAGLAGLSFFCFS